MMMATIGALDGEALGDEPGEADTVTDGEGGATVGATEGSSIDSTATCRGGCFGANSVAI
jgi:hypothetical protein